MPAPSGLTPSDSCYVKHLPASYGVQEVQQLFETHGAVLDVKLFPCLGELLEGRQGISGQARPRSCLAVPPCCSALYPPRCRTNTVALLLALPALQTSSAARARWCAWPP